MKPVTKLVVLQLVLPVLYGLVFYLGHFNAVGNALWITTLFSLGMYIGVGILIADQNWLYRYYQPDDPLRLVTRSFLFMVTLTPLGILLITSTGSVMGVGMLLGIAAGLLVELLWYRENHELFHHMFLSQIKRQFSAAEIKWLVYTASALVAAFSVLVLL